MSQGNGPVQHFLIVFDRQAGRLIELVEFGSDGERALEEYTARERASLKDRRLEIVLIGSDSLDTVKVTHANYFDDFAKVSKYFDLAEIAVSE